MQRSSRRALALLSVAVMASGCAVDAASLGRLLGNGVAVVPVRPAQPVVVAPDGVQPQPGIRVGLRRAIPKPPATPPSARPMPEPLPPMPEPWVAPVMPPDRMKGALAFMPDQPVGPASLRALAALAELEGEFSLATMALLDRPEVVAALGGQDPMPEEWPDFATVFPCISTASRSCPDPAVEPGQGPEEPISDDGGGLVSNDGGGLIADSGEGTSEGSEGEGITSNFGGILVSNNSGGALVSIKPPPPPPGQSAGYRLAQADMGRSAALVVAGPMAIVLVQRVRSGFQPGRLDGDLVLDQGLRDGRRRAIRHHIDGRSLVVDFEVGRGPNQPPALLTRRVDYADGMWFHRVTGRLGSMTVDYTVEGRNGGGGYLEGPEGFVSFHAVDPNAPIYPYPGPDMPMPEPMPWPSGGPEPWVGPTPSYPEPWEDGRPLPPMVSPTPYEGDTPETWAEPGATSTPSMADPNAPVLRPMPSPIPRRF